MSAARIGEAYRWHRRLGATLIETPCCRIVADPAHPQVWDSNHADEVTASAPEEIDAVFAAMQRHLTHTPWRVVHSDGFTPDAFLARLAFEGFEERPLTIQMALEADVAAPRAVIDLRPVESAADWSALADLALANHAEGRTTGGLEIEREITLDMVAGYRGKSPQCRFHLAFSGGQAIAYGAAAAAPRAVIDLRPVESAADWSALADLALANHAEGRTTGGLEIEREITLDMVAGYRGKSPQCRFHLAFSGGQAIAYGAAAAAPNGVGMIEDLFTAPDWRRRGVASAMIAAFVADLRQRGCDMVFLGALAQQRAKTLYRRLGFAPVALARAWVKQTR